MSDTKIALIVRHDLAMWQKLNVVAFLATGIASETPEAIGETYIDSNHQHYGKILGLPMLVFTANLMELQKSHRKALELELTIIPYVEAMFTTKNDVDNRQVFFAEDANKLNLVGLALVGHKKAVDKAIKNLKLHP